jgi:sphinganine-1-phosphate aldolase
MLIVLLGSLFIFWVKNKVSDFWKLTKRRGLIRLMLALPFTGGFVDQCERSHSQFRESLPKTIHEPLKAIPVQGWSKSQIIARLNDFQKDEKSQVEDPKVSGVVFTSRNDIQEIAAIACSKFLYTNVMYYAKTGPSRQLENEVIQFTRDMLNGTPEMTGLTTSGGSESIFLSMLAHKRYFLRERGISKPNIVLSETAHMAFRKAAEYQEIEMKIVNVDRKTLANTPEQFEAAIDSNTICIICSVPNYPYGTIDPIEEMSEMAGRHNVGFHIDGCMGSYLLPFVEYHGIKTGHKYVDLRIANVTAFSIDTHKYGLTAKGSAVVIFPNKNISKALYFGSTDWIGGIYGTTMIAGSRTSALIASAWAVMVSIGYEGYARFAKDIFDATEEYVGLLRKLDKWVRVVGNPKLGNVTTVSNNPKIDMYKLGTLMNQKGWYFMSGMSVPSLMFTITDKNIGMMASNAKDLETSIHQLLENPNIELGGFFKIAHEISKYPGWITSKVLADSLQELYEVDSLEHSDEHKLVIQEKMAAEVKAANLGAKGPPDPKKR